MDGPILRRFSKLNGSDIPKRTVSKRFKLAEIFKMDGLWTLKWTVHVNCPKIQKRTVYFGLDLYFYLLYKEPNCNIGSETVNY